MLFASIIGQEPVAAKLRDLVQQNRLSHALLFSGKEGSGALPLANAFAQFLSCEKIQAAIRLMGQAGLFDESPGVQLPPEACGVCAGCTKSSAMIHPDIHYSFPSIIKKKSPALSSDWMVEFREFILQFPYGNLFDWLQFIGAENKQGNITAEECNEILRKLSIKSHESDYKILIMWMPEYLGNEGNKLLKLIEEPPANTVFILVCENESLILPTILSRTQLVRIPLPRAEAIASALEARAEIPAAKALEVAMLSEGNYREALNLLNHAGEDWQGLLRSWLNAVVKKQIIVQTKWVDEISAQGREKQKQFFRYCTHLIEQALRLSLIDSEEMLMVESERDFASRLNKMLGIEQLEAIITEFDRAAYHIERNANPKMLFQALTIKLSYIINEKSLILVN